VGTIFVYEYIAVMLFKAYITIHTTYTYKILQVNTGNLKMCREVEMLVAVVKVGRECDRPQLGCKLTTAFDNLRTSSDKILQNGTVLNGTE